MCLVIAQGLSFTGVQRGTVWVKVLWTFKAVGHFSCAVVGNHFIVASITLTLIHSSPHSLLKSFCFQCIQQTFSVSTLQYCSLKPVNQLCLKFTILSVTCVAIKLLERHLWIFFVAGLVYLPPPAYKHHLCNHTCSFCDSSLPPFLPTYM